MRVCYVVQRYGHDVAGGAEAHCRDYAERLAARGHDVEVLTTTARDYVTWNDALPAGTAEEGGVVVHRLPVRRPRDPERFADLDARVVSPGYVPLWLQREWMRLQGPFVPELVPWLEARAPSYDLVVFVTYLYFTTWAGLAAASAGAPTVLHPTAHDEAYLYLRLFEDVFRAPSAFAFLTPEEERLVRRRFGTRAPGAVVGVGADLDVEGDAQAFRRQYGLGDRPYLLYVGRFDVGKASDELVAYFTAFKDRQPGPLALVLVGQPVQAPPDHPDIVVTGFVDEATKHAALAGAEALVQPSYYESFSMVLVEAWGHRRPALVQGRCDVLAGQVRRSGGGIPYEGFAEFETAIEMVLGDEALRRDLGDAGRRYAEEHYRWGRVMDAYEAHLEVTARLRAG